MASFLTLENLGAVTAAYIGAKVSLRLLRSVKHLLTPATDVTKLGKWAVVTGATDGIGKEFAFQLAQKGVNIVLISRNPDKLKQVASEIESQHRVQTKTVAVDFTQSDEEYEERVEAELKGLEIGVLVNNVGMMYEYPNEYLAVKGGAKKIRDLVSVNVTAINAMTRICLPAMVARKRGALINISSMVSAVPGPLVAVYAATKAYDEKFSVSLEHEYGRKGITVQTLLPGSVVTNMNPRPESLDAPSAKKWVRSALSRLGVRSHSGGYWVHDLFLWLADVLPTSFSGRAFYKMCDAVRQKYSALEKDK